MYTAHSFVDIVICIRLGNKTTSVFLSAYKFVDDFLGPSYGRYPIRFVSYLGGRVVLCVGNG